MFRRLSLLWRRFTPFEEFVLAEVERILPTACKEKFVKQRQAINGVQRLLDWTEISFYSTRHGAVHWDPGIMFRNRGELALAEIRFSIHGRDFRSTLWCVGGHIFSLVTRPSIKLYAFERITDLHKVKQLGDPENSSEDAPVPRILPSGYMAWISVPARQAENGWVVYDISEVYEVNLSDGDYTVLAIRDGAEFLLAKANVNDPNIYYSETHGVPSCKGPDFAALVRK